MTTDPDKARQVAAFLDDPANDGISNREAARVLGVHESYVRRIKDSSAGDVTMLFRIDEIRLDGGTQIRESINRTVVDEYAERWKAGEKFPPVVVFYDGTDYWCADGFHRIQGAIEAGVAKIDCKVKQGDRRSAVLWACGCNERHGLRRNQKDRRRAVETMLSDPEWSQWSDSEIARKCDVSHQTVGRVRESLIPSNGRDNGHPDTRVVTRGGTTYEQKVAKSAGSKLIPAANGTPEPAAPKRGLFHTPNGEIRPPREEWEGIIADYPSIAEKVAAGVLTIEGAIEQVYPGTTQYTRHRRPGDDDHYGDDDAEIEMIFEPVDRTGETIIDAPVSRADAPVVEAAGDPEPDAEQAYLDSIPMRRELTDAQRAVFDADALAHRRAVAWLDQGKAMGLASSKTGQRVGPWKSKAGSLLRLSFPHGWLLCKASGCGPDCDVCYGHGYVIK